MKYLLRISFTALLFVGFSQTALAQINTAEGGAGNVLPNADTKNTNVGIGTDEPASKLSVVGGVSVGDKYSGIEAPEYGAIIEGNVGIGTNSPTSKLDVIGLLKAETGAFTHSMPNGSTFASGADRNDKCLVLSAGSLLGSGPGYAQARMLAFYDFPQSNIDVKPIAWFGIEDRNDFNRYRFYAQAGGYTNMIMHNKSQQVIMGINEDGNDNLYMHFPKPNSRVIIGGLENNPNAAGHKLFVQSGSARVEGDILTDSKVGIGNGTAIMAARLNVAGGLTDGQTFASGDEKNQKSWSLNAGSVVNPVNGARMLKFFDYPQSNLNTKSLFWFAIDDRSNNQRFRVHAQTAGYGTLELNDKNQTEVLKVSEDGNGNAFMHLPKPNSKVVIGGLENNPNAVGHKLFVQGGSARVEGNIVTDAKVGIGVADPKFKLDIEGGGANGVTFASNADRDSKVLILNAGAVVDASTGRRMLTFSDYPQSNLNPQSWSWFGIEDRADNNRLHFTATQGGYSDLTLNNGAQEPYFRASNNANFSYLEMPKADSHFVIGGTQAYPIAHQLWVKSGTTRLEGDLFAATNVGIGTTNFVDGDKTYRLSVKGNIRAEEVKVYNTWADYVFAPEYKLPTLKEVESYIKENGHLQNVPSAKEVTEKGLELGEMAKIQQEKIEELTLYLIQQNKEIEELKTLVKALMDKK